MRDTGFIGRRHRDLHALDQFRKRTPAAAASVRGSGRSGRGADLGADQQGYERGEPGTPPQVRQDPAVVGQAFPAHRGVSTPGPKAAATCASPEIPGATTSRAIASVSMTGTPRSANIAAAVDFPLPMPPVSPTTSMGQP